MSGNFSRVAEDHPKSVTWGQYVYRSRQAGDCRVGCELMVHWFIGGEGDVVVRSVGPDDSARGFE